MIATRRIQPSVTKQYVRTLRHASTSNPSQHGRAAAYRRLGAFDLQQHHPRNNPCWLDHPHSTSKTISASRSIHSSRALSQQAQPKQEPAQEEARDPPRPSEQSTDQQTKSESNKTEEEANSGEGEKKSDAKDAPPPPPHGDKTPWQVFADTFRSGLKESKEWNESTKLLQGEVHEFRESEGVKKASAAYEATVGRAGRGAQTAAKVVGHGAAWTWETPVVQGVRKGVNATGRGIEQATRPIRETEAFKAMSEAIDDGSSSRYGGWIEKEERRKRREAREAREGFKTPEKMDEDPE